MSKFDYFGHQTKLLYRGDQSSRQTACGGICSLMVIVYITIMFFTNMRKVYKTDTTVINNMQGYLNLTEMGPVEYKDTHMKVFYTVKNDLVDHFDSSELSRYFNITYEVVRQTFK